MTFARIVIRAPNWLGDIVMAVPAIAAIRQAFGGSTVALALPAPFASLGQAIGGVDEVLPLDGTGVSSVRRHARALAGGRFDLGILLTNSFASALALKMADVPARWGSARDFRSPLLTRAVHKKHARAASLDGQPFPPTHQVTYYLALLNALEIAPAAGPFTMAVTAESRARARELLEAGGWTPETPLIALAPGAAYGQAKRWPPERAAEALAAFAARGLRSVLVGAASDRGAADAIAAVLRRQGAAPASIGAASIDLVGRTSLADLMGVFSWCRVVVSNDSGAMHLAAGLGRPVVAVFGPTDEHRTAPIGPHVIVKHDVWCRPCLLRECPIDHRCLRGVGAGRVVDAVADWLARPEGALA